MKERHCAVLTEIIQVLWVLPLVLPLLAAQPVSAQHDTKTLLFVGSYTDGKMSDGIYVYEFDMTNGSMIEVEREAQINPSFLTISPDGNHLYACTETQLESAGFISAYQIDTGTGEIHFLNKQTTGGRNPVHVVVDRNNRFVVSANYTDPIVCVFEIHPDGSLKPASTKIAFQGNSIIPGRQDSSHIHSVNVSPDNDYILAPDLGADKIWALSLESGGSITQVDSLNVETTKGGGPRHFTFHPNARFAYCIEELSGSVSVFSYQRGRLALIDRHRSYARNQNLHASADIHISPDGRFLYASNRNDEHSIAIFSIDPKTGKLISQGHQSTLGTVPRSFVIDPSGQYLIVANQTSSTLVVFKRDMETGQLEKTGTEIHVPSPSSLKMATYEK